MPDKTAPGGSGEDLLATLVQANYNQYADTTQHLIDNLTQDANRLRATLNCIRDSIAAAYEKPYTPNPNWVLGLLYPSKAELQPYLEEDVT